MCRHKYPPNQHMCRHKYPPNQHTLALCDHC
jgi:hypothetical protein